MRRWVIFIIVFAMAVSMQATRAGSLVQFRTTVGDMDVELYDQDKPVTVNNFLKYVSTGMYTNMVFHRWVPDFVVQGGGYTITNRHTAGADFSVIPSYGNITNEFGVGKLLSNVYGTIAMAKVGGDPNSASSQWFFNVHDNSANLDNQNGGFTVFGKVLRGTNVLNKFVSQTSGIYLLSNGIPVTNSTATFDDLIYVDISLLNVQVVKTNVTSQITWNSVTGQTNVVEYTTSVPPVWNTLVTTNGNGTSYTVKDLNPASAARFYRVRVVY